MHGGNFNDNDNTNDFQQQTAKSIYVIWLAERNERNSFPFMMATRTGEVRIWKMFLKNSFK